MQHSADTIGIVIIAHSLLGESMIHCAEHIMGRTLTHVAALSVSKNEDPQAIVVRAEALIQRVNRGRGVLLLTDIYGGTPSNIAGKLLQPGVIEGVAGVSLPMLMRALTYCREPMEIMVSKTITGGWEGVMYMLPGGLDVDARC